MKKLLLLFVGVLPLAAMAQVSYTVTVTKLRALADDCDGGIITLCANAPQDPIFNIWTIDAEANENTYCWIFEDDPEAEYGLWKDIQNVEIANETNVLTSYIRFEMSGYESDNLSPGCDNPMLGDDQVMDRQLAQQFDLSAIPEDSNYTVSININDVYFAQVVIHWIDLTAGLSQMNNEFDFSLVPNPTNGSFKINLEGQGVDQFNATVTDIAGRVVYQEENLAHQAEIDLTTNEGGTYFVTVDFNGITETRRLMIR